MFVWNYTKHPLQSCIHGGQFKALLLKMTLTRIQQFYLFLAAWWWNSHKDFWFPPNSLDETQVEMYFWALLSTLLSADSKEGKTSSSVGQHSTYRSVGKETRNERKSKASENQWRETVLTCGVLIGSINHFSALDLGLVTCRVMALESSAASWNCRCCLWWRLQSLRFVIFLNIL